MNFSLTIRQVLVLFTEESRLSEEERRDIAEGIEILANHQYLGDGSDAAAVARYIWLTDFLDKLSQPFGQKLNGRHGVVS